MTEMKMEPSNELDRVSAPDALERVKSELLAVPRSERVHINQDVPLVVTTILGSLPELRTIRQQLVDELKTFDVERFDKLVIYVRALYFANVCHVATNTPSISLQELVAEATKLRDLMHPDLLALANRGLLDPHEIKEVKRQPGHRGLAMDLQIMAFALQRSGDKVKGKTATNNEEIARAIFLADRLLDGVGLRDQAPEKVREAAELRNNAYSLVVRLWEEIRSGVAYVRRNEGDADAIAPSLFAGRGGRMRRSDEADPTAPDAATPPAQSGAPAPSQSITPPAAAVPPAATPNVAVGLPGSPAFLRT